jgi:hypothetical protein
LTSKGETKHVARKQRPERKVPLEWFADVDERERKSHQQIAEMFYRMFDEAGHRPGCTSPGRPDEQTLKEEAIRYAHDWWKQEDYGDYHVGIPSFVSRQAMVLLVEAAGALAGDHWTKAMKLTKMAQRLIKPHIPPDPRRWVKRSEASA